MFLLKFEKSDFWVLAISLVLCFGAFYTAPALAQDAPVPEELLADPSTSVPDQTERPVILPGEPRFTLPDDRDARRLPFENYSDIPQEALDDMQDLFDSCEKSYIERSHFDCECRASRYLEERIKAGPIVPREQITLGLRSECFNQAGAAGFGYQFCRQNGRLNYSGNLSPEEYCECVGRNYAIMFMNSEGRPLTNRRINSMRSSALARCRGDSPGSRNMLRRLDTPLNNP
ncbi:MAG: hypothetical protein ACK4VI_00285 [Alphaproteobacteria bacterium]